MSNAVEDFLNALKRTINGDPYPVVISQRYAPIRYRVAKVRDPLQGLVLSCKYRIEARLGVGGMASVYKATQEPIGRVVALKILRHEFSQDPINIKRFNREAKIISNLRHRNILNIHDVGNTDTGQPFFVMEFLDGVSLESLILKRGPIVIPRAIPIFCQICDGMSYAHNKGLIHRDIKPGNVMIVREDDGSEAVKVVDFGIVKQSNPQSVTQRLTKKGEIWGSPVYMSPEQCMGTELDARSDVYSLGLLMYETLTGVSPFDGGLAIGKLVSRQLTQMPAPFSVAAPNLHIPETLEQIVVRAIQKRPDDRYSNMDEMREALDLFGRQHGIKIPKSTISRAKPGFTDSGPMMQADLISQSTYEQERFELFKSSSVPANGNSNNISAKVNSAPDSVLDGGSKRNVGGMQQSSAPERPFADRTVASQISGVPFDKSVRDRNFDSENHDSRSEAAWKAALPGADKERSRNVGAAGSEPPQSRGDAVRRPGQQSGSDQSQRSQQSGDDRTQRVRGSDSAHNGQNNLTVSTDHLRWIIGGALLLVLIVGGLAAGITYLISNQKSNSPATSTTGGAKTGAGSEQVRSGGAQVGSGGAQVGSGGAQVGSRGAQVGSGSAAQVGSRGAQVGPGGAAQVGPGSAQVGPGGAQVGSGGAQVGSSGAQVGPNNGAKTEAAGGTESGAAASPNTVTDVTEASTKSSAVESKKKLDKNVKPHSRPHNAPKTHSTSAADEETLERIHLKKHHGDATQQWMEIQQKMSQ